MPVRTVVCKRCGTVVQSLAQRTEYLETADPLTGTYRVPSKVLYRVDCPHCGVVIQESDVSAEAAGCPTPNCGSPFIYSQGLCLACFNAYEELVACGVVTWELFEERGIAR